MSKNDKSECVLSMRSMRWFATLVSFMFALVLGQSASYASGSTLIDNASNPDRAVIIFPDYSISPPGKWTIVVVNGKSLRFRSLDGTQNMQAGTVDVHPKAQQTEDEAFRSYVDERRQREHENVDNKALISDTVRYTSDQRGRLAFWCIIDPAGASGHLTAILENKRKLLVVSYDADKVSETEFRKHAAMLTNSMALR